MDDCWKDVPGWGNKRIKSWHDVPGWFSQFDAEFITNLCRGVEGGLVVEVGTFAGRSTAVIAPICASNSTEFHALDNFIGAEEDKPGGLLSPGSYGCTIRCYREKQGNHVRDAFERNMRSLGLWGQFVLHECDSVAGAGLFKDNSIDLCFIDADHSLHGVRRDIIAWWTKIKPGATISGHDYGGELAELVNAFATFVGSSVQHGRRGRRRRRHRCWAIRKEQAIP